MSINFEPLISIANNIPEKITQFIDDTADLDEYNIHTSNVTEFRVYENSRDIHLLGYWMDFNYPDAFFSIYEVTELPTYIQKLIPREKWEYITKNKFVIMLVTKD